MVKLSDFKKTGQEAEAGGTCKKSGFLWIEPGENCIRTWDITNYSMALCKSRVQSGKSPLGPEAGKQNQALRGNNKKYARPKVDI